MFNGPANFRTFHQRKRHKSCSKYLYFLCRKSLRNGIGLRQDLYLSNLNTVELFNNFISGMIIYVILRFRSPSMTVHSG